jgi:hypothetical protein
MSGLPGLGERPPVSLTDDFDLGFLDLALMT